MASGGPGDHWQSDLFVWEAEVFGEPADSLLHEISALGGQRDLADGTPLGTRLAGLWPRGRRKDADGIAALARDLEQLRDRLRSQARERGWEVD